MITLRPVGPVKRIELMPRLSDGLASVMGMPCQVGDHLLAIDSAYDPERRQYSAPWLLHLMRSIEIAPGVIELGVTDADLYADGLTFVFGQAEMPGQWAIISLHRLALNGGRGDDDLLYRRALIEAVHEVGHTLGLAHCPDPGCVMHFSSGLEDTDRKGPELCAVCRRRARR